MSPRSTKGCRAIKKYCYKIIYPVSRQLTAKIYAVFPLKREINLNCNVNIQYLHYSKLSLFITKANQVMLYWKKSPFNVITVRNTQIHCVAKCGVFGCRSGVVFIPTVIIVI